LAEEVVVSLSEEERRVLDEMERQLRASSSDIVTVPVSRRVNAAAAVSGVIVVVAGIGVLLAGIVLGLTPLGVVGFVAMVAGVLLAMKRDNSAPTQPKANRPNTTPSSSTSSSRIEDRWDKRMGGEL
jgi:F0F1-type ATP synthase assembly protein I